MTETGACVFRNVVVVLVELSRSNIALGLAINDVTVLREGLSILAFVIKCMMMGEEGVKNCPLLREVIYVRPLSSFKLI